MPHITEELYQLYFKHFEKDISIHISSWPVVDEKQFNDALEKEGDECISIITQARQFKTQNQKPLKEEINLTLPLAYENSLFLADLLTVTKAKKIIYGKELAFSL